MQYRIIENGHGEYVIQQQPDNATIDVWTYVSHHWKDTASAMRELEHLQYKDKQKKLMETVVRVVR